MEGNRPVVLIEPRPTGEVNDVGESIFDEPRLHRTWAVRKDSQSGAEGEIASGILGGEWQTTFTIREQSVAGRPTESWDLVDEHGTVYDIERVAEKNSGARARWLVLVCERRQPE